MNRFLRLLTPGDVSVFYPRQRISRISAESPDDAKRRAEAEVRAGDEFEAIQDSWPEEIVSVDALAVEPYPDLE